MKENISELMLKGLFTNPHQHLGLQPIDENSQVIRIWRPKLVNPVLEVFGEVVEPALKADVWSLPVMPLPHGASQA